MKSEEVFSAASAAHPGLEAALERFHAFVEPYMCMEPEHAARIKLKYDHTLRVLENARRIVEDDDPLPDRRECVLTAALFHDIGRFPQYERYHTFHDPGSLNHAHLGARTLQRHDLLRDYSYADRRFIKAAVILHNRKLLPPAIPQHIRAAVNVVRDADKLDILKVMLDTFAAEGEDDPVVVLHVKPHPEKYSRVVLDKAMQGIMGDYREMVWVNDFKILMLSWAYDLNFPSSRKVYLERGLLDGILAALPDVPEIRSLGRRVREYLEQANKKIGMEPV